MAKGPLLEHEIEGIKHLADEDRALAFVARLRWPRGPRCPRCTSGNVSFLRTRRLWKCRACQKQFSVKVGTIFENSPIALSTWVLALWVLIKRRRIRSYELAQALGVTQKTASLMLRRIRLAMKAPSFRGVNVRRTLGEAAAPRPTAPPDRVGEPIGAGSPASARAADLRERSPHFAINPRRHLAYAQLRKTPQVVEQHQRLTSATRPSRPARRS